MIGFAAGRVEADPLANQRKSGKIVGPDSGRGSDFAQGCGSIHAAPRQYQKGMLALRVRRSKEAPARG